MNVNLGDGPAAQARFQKMLAAMAEPEGDHGLPMSLWQRLEELRTLLRGTDPVRLAARAGATLRPNALELPVWARAAEVGLNDFNARDCTTGLLLDPLTQVMVAYHLHTADGVLPAGRWIAFSELPDGLFYAQAFQTYSGHKLAQRFGNDEPAFARAAITAGGRAVTFGDRAYTFRVFPCVSLLVACWWGDEELSASFRILFDANASHHLPTDACAVLGSVLTRRLLRAAC
jgi:hypothetical protein